MTAVDGTDVLKALRVRVRDDERKMKRAVRRVFDIVKWQAAQIAELTGAPKRPSTVWDTIYPNEFFAKALQAHSDGRISALDISQTEALLGSRQPPPSELVRRVLG